MFGCDYIVEHCVTAIQQKRRKQTAAIYIADTLKNINEIFAKQYGGSYMTESVSELLEHKKPEKERSGDEIAEDIIKRAGLTVKGGS